jgi:hemerythrin-like domain-containing protein
MDPREILREQHRDVLALLKRLTSGNDTRHRAGLVEQVAAKLQLHTRLEESLLYPAVQRLDTKKAEEVVLESYEEHEIVDFLLARLPAMDLTSERFLAGCRVLQSLLEEHIQEEEEEVFALAERLGQQGLDVLAARMQSEIREVERVNELLDRAATAAQRTEHWAGRLLDLSLGLPRRAASQLSPARLLALPNREVLADAIAARVPRFIVDSVYDTVVRSGPASARERDGERRMNA